MVDREFNLSYASMLPASNEMLEGRWLDPDRNEVSLEIGLAQTLNIHVNDSLTFDVAGRLVRVAVSGLRTVDWDSFPANFFAIPSPAALADAPASFITSIHVSAKDRPAIRELLHAFPKRRRGPCGERGGR